MRRYNPLIRLPKVSPSIVKQAQKTLFQSKTRLNSEQRQKKKQRERERENGYGVRTWAEMESELVCPEEIQRGKGAVGKGICWSVRKKEIWQSGSAVHVSAGMGMGASAHAGSPTLLASRRPIFIQCSVLQTARTEVWYPLIQRNV